MASFKALTVSTNATVAAGDHLGFWISEEAVGGRGVGFTSLIPYCHLEYHTCATNGTKAPAGQRTFQQAGGQNSWRGLEANISPIQERRGVGVKFFATVN